MAVLLLVLGVLLIAALAAAMLWQERHPPPESRHAVVYGVDDSVTYVWEGLDPGMRSRLRQSDVRRILEWEMHYLQHPELRASDEPAVVGGLDAAAYAQDRSAESGHGYEPDAIFAVLDLQAEYLAAIGAVAEAADPSDEPSS